MLFFIGFVAGFAFCFIFFMVSYIILREIIYKYGQQIRRRLEHELDGLEEKTKFGTEIIFPDDSKDIFKNEDTTIDDLVKK